MRHDREADTTLLNELERSSSLLRATLESTADGILVVDLEGHIVLHNRRFAELWRLPDDILQARNDEAAISWVLEQLKDPDAFLFKVRELYASPDASSYDILEFKDGRVFERYSQPQVIEGKSAGRVWSFRDVTERRLLQNQLSMSQKMEAVGRLAGGVAHDFNNLLTAIIGHAELLKDQLEEGSQAIGDVEEIERAAERATSLTRQLLAFSRRQVLQPVVLDINETVEGVRRMFERVIGEHIKLEFQLAAKGMVKADPAQLDQVLINLALNARDAMPKGGTLGVDTSDVVLDAEYVSRHPGSREGPHVRLSVWDTGFGMEQQVIERIFEPFYTTKPNGTGLGLSTVYGIVKQSGGHIAVLSEPGCGSRFTIHLPRVDEPAAKRPSPSGETASPGTETILLVEDEEIVRELSAKVLRGLGYTVLAASGGPEAFELLAKHSGKVALLLADVVMPDMSGPAVAERLTKERPGLKVLYMSGYADESMVEQGMLSRGAPFLPKPFTPQALAAKVRSVLDEGPRT